MWIDLVFIAVSLYGFWQGWNQGIIGTLLNLAVYAFGILIAFKMAPVTSVVLSQLLDSSHPMVFIGGFALNLLVIYLVVKLATNQLEELLSRAYLGAVNRLIGGFMVATFYVLLFSVLIWFLNQANGISPSTIREAKSYPLLEPMPGTAKKIAIRFQPLVADAWADFNRWLDKAQEYGNEKTQGKGRVYELPEPDQEGDLFERTPKKSGKSSSDRSNPIEPD
ncbi:MAG: CvpA family protein [Chitinophagales bacterium]|jgi:uncharacterized membrane protein required for colicin V production